MSQKFTVNTEYILNVNFEIWNEYNVDKCVLHITITNTVYVDTFIVRICK